MNRNRLVRGRTAAFTLIEVMVALVIVAVSLSAVLASVSQQVRYAGSIQERTFASWIAQNRIAEIRLSNASPDVDTTTDEVRFAYVDWATRTTISETGVDNLWRIDVDVSIAGSDSVIWTVTGFVGQPAIPGQANLAWTRMDQAAGEDR